MMNAAVINMSEMDLVVGGTFTSNKYSKEEKKHYDIDTIKRFILKLEYDCMDFAASGHRL